MSGDIHMTTDHAVIRGWAEARGGRPAEVAQTGDGQDPGVLRIAFPGQGSEDALRTIGWDDFFDKFDRNKLAFVYQDRLKDGEISRFSKFVSREDR